MENLELVHKSFVRTIDDYYGTGMETLHGGPMVLNANGTYSAGNKGYYNFAFGGLLQSYVTTDSNNDGIKYSVTVTDQKNYQLSTYLNSYGGSTGGKTNLWNIYGFLEHNAMTVSWQQNDPDTPNDYKVF